MLCEKHDDFEKIIEQKNNLSLNNILTYFFLNKNMLKEQKRIFSIMLLLLIKSMSIVRSVFLKRNDFSFGLQTLLKYNIFRVYFFMQRQHKYGKALLSTQTQGVKKNKTEAYLYSHDHSYGYMFKVVIYNYNKIYIHMVFQISL